MLQGAAEAAGIQWPLVGTHSGRTCARISLVCIPATVERGQQCGDTSQGRDEKFRLASVRLLQALQGVGISGKGGKWPSDLCAWQ